MLAVLFSLLCQKRAKKRNSDTAVLEMIDSENDTEQQQLTDYDKARAQLQNYNSC